MDKDIKTQIEMNKVLLLFILLTVGILFGVYIGYSMCHDWIDMISKYGCYWIEIKNK